MPSCDFYNTDCVFDGRNFQLDHVLEVQIIVYTVYLIVMEYRINFGSLPWAIKLLKQFVNDFEENVRPTSKWMNNLKSAVTRKRIQDTDPRSDQAHEKSRDSSAYLTTARKQLSTKIENVKKEKGRLQADIENLQNALKSGEEKVATVSEILEAKRLEISEKRAKLTRIAQGRPKTKKALEALEEEIRQLDDNVQTLVDDRKRREKDLADKKQKLKETIKVLSELKDLPQRLEQVVEKIKDETFNCLQNLEDVLESEIKNRETELSGINESMA
ncbi:hypothetical protein HDU96_006558 [Phlyctochytrium bullatum]|nr:hypothetical protein HDU96_006558 [Phlyctochytrium bullatum]